jgi:hypothetical protein
MCPECGAEAEYQYSESEYDGTTDFYECPNGHEWEEERD